MCSAFDADPHLVADPGQPLDTLPHRLPDPAAERKAQL